MITEQEKIKMISDIDKKISMNTLLQGIVGSIGSLGGIYYAQKTGGGFWRSFGYFVLGGILIGGITRVATYQSIMSLKEQKESIKNLPV